MWPISYTLTSKRDEMYTDYGCSEMINIRNDKYPDIQNPSPRSPLRTQFPQRPLVCPHRQKITVRQQSRNARRLGFIYSKAKESLESSCQAYILYLNGKTNKCIWIINAAYSYLHTVTQVYIGRGILADMPFQLIVKNPSVY